MTATLATSRTPSLPIVPVTEWFISKLNSSRSASIARTLAGRWRLELVRRAAFPHASAADGSRHASSPVVHIIGQSGSANRPHQRNVVTSAMATSGLALGDVVTNRNVLTLAGIGAGLGSPDPTSLRCGGAACPLFDLSNAKNEKEPIPNFRQSDFCCVPVPRVLTCQRTRHMQSYDLDKTRDRIAALFLTALFIAAIFATGNG